MNAHLYSRMKLSYLWICDSSDIIKSRGLGFACWTLFQKLMMQTIYQWDKALASLINLLVLQEKVFLNHNLGTKPDSFCPTFDFSCKWIIFRKDVVPFVLLRLNIIVKVFSIVKFIWFPCTSAGILLKQLPNKPFSQLQLSRNELHRMMQRKLTFFCLYLMASFNLARFIFSTVSTPCPGPDPLEATGPFVSWLSIVSNSLDPRVWSSSAVANVWHCLARVSYSSLNSFSRRLSLLSSHDSSKAVSMGSLLDKAIRDGLAKAR